MNEDKKLILKMLSEGKINVNEAQKLLDTQNGQEVPEERFFSKPVNKKFLKVFVKEGDDTKVNINVPLALAEVGLKLIPKDRLKIEGKEYNINEILSLIKEGHDGELINVETIDKGKEVKVKIFIE